MNSTIKDHNYWLKKCLEKADESNCKKAHFGSYIVKNGIALGSGCNHVIRKDKCCLKPSNYQIGSNPGLCWAVHAEWEALLKALRDHGNEVIDSILYIAGKYPDGRIRKHTWFSCTVCARLLFEAGIAYEVRIDDNGNPLLMTIEGAVNSAYRELIEKGGGENI